jgi:hypothetical protein
MGHGEPGAAAALLDWEAEYIRRFVSAVRSADAVATSGGETKTEDQALVQDVTRQMKSYLPTDDLLFLMQLSIPPVRQQLRSTA